MSYKIRDKALAIQLLCAGIPQNRVARIVNCSPQSINYWFSQYRGYRGDNIELIIKQSKV